MLAWPTAHHRKWQYILVDTGESLQYRQAPNPAKLMNHDSTAEKHPVSHLDMPSDRGTAGKNIAIAQTGVMADMGVIHEIIAGADPGCSPSLGCPADRYPFTEHIVIANIERGNASGIKRQILRLTTQHRRGMNAIVAPHADMGMDDGVRLDDA